MFNDFIGVDLPEPGFTLGNSPTSTTRKKDAIATAFREVGWTPDGDVFYDYDTTTPADHGTGNCTCVEACFTATAYGDLDGDGTMSAMVFSHPDVAGNFCESALLGLSAPINAAGDRMFDEVARVPQGLADDF